MPLYKRKPFPLAEPPEDLKPGELVHQIRYTKEIFRDYQEYLNRLNFYRQKVWACKITGKTNLTYEEALVSESRATEKVLQFPKELMAPVLQKIQYSTLSLKELVDSLYKMLQEQLFEGLELHGRKEETVNACKILKILEEGDTIKYEVGWLDKDKIVTETAKLMPEDLIRKKSPYSKSVLKAFIRQSTSQTSPWLIHEGLAKKHGISMEPPHDLTCRVKEGTKGNEKTVNKKRKGTENGGMDTKKKKAKKGEESSYKEPLKYPIDDLLVQPDPSYSDHPSLCTKFKVPMDCVGDLLMVWDFCFSFGRVLNLYRFSLEDFENAICHKDNSNLILIVEAHTAILRLLIEDEGDYFSATKNKKRKSKITLINWTDFLCDFLEMEGRSKFSNHLGTIKRGHYGLLDIDVKLDIFQELVSEAVNSNAIRARLDECIAQQQLINKRRREKQDAENEVSDNRKHMNGLNMSNGNCSDKVTNMSITKEGKKRQQRKKLTANDDQEKHSEEGQKASVEKELEKLSVLANPLGKDRNYNRYWFFRHEGKLFVESPDSKLWGYYTSKEELDALVSSLNPKGVRERALQKQMEKHYQRISMALQKKSKEAAQKVLEDGDLRRSTRVRTPTREKPAFFAYVNKWKKD